MLTFIETNILPARLIETARGHVAMTKQEKEEALVKAQTLLEPGDIMLVKTPSMFYSGLRKVFKNEYDHALVIVDKERCLHITYPRAKLVPVVAYMHITREAMVIKPTEKAMTSGLRQQFIYDIKHASVGKGYDSLKVFQFMRRSMLDKVRSQASEFGQTLVNNAGRLRWKLGIIRESNVDGKTIEIVQTQQTQRESKEIGRKNEKLVCSDQIFKHLCVAVPELNKSVEHDELGLLGDLDYHVGGMFTPQDLFRVAKAHSPSLFTLAKSFTDEELEQHQQKQGKKTTPEPLPDSESPVTGQGKLPSLAKVNEIMQ